MKSFLWVMLCGGLCTSSVQASVNNWTNPFSDKWESSSSWSLGTSPASDQSVNILNSGYKAVNIDSASVAGYASSLTVGSLQVGAPNNALSTLLLNSFGENTSLKVLNSCIIQSNGMILNSYSSFEVAGNASQRLTFNGGTFTQEGGLTVVNPTTELESGTINATNATMNLGALNMGDDFTGRPGNVTQSGGTVLIADLRIDIGSYTLLDNGTLYSLDSTILYESSAHFDQISGTNYGDVQVRGGSYNLHDGLLHGNDLFTTGNDGFVQSGGTAEFATIEIQGPGGGAGSASYNLQSGTLHCGNLSFTAFGIFQQSAGTTTLTNGLNLDNAVITLYGGTVTMPSMVVTNAGAYQHYGGTNRVAGDVELYDTGFLIQGGMLSSVNLGVGGGGEVGQYGGRNEISGVLSITGTYYLGNGVLSVNGVYLRGSLVILNLDPAPVFINTGVINFGGAINVDVPQSSMGQLGLSADGTINLGNSSVVLRFADSSALNWDPNSRLAIGGWRGSYSGGGSNQIYFGNSSGGLTASQLSQVRFSNPAGLPAGTYPAKLLNTGELVPDNGGTGTNPNINAWIKPTSGIWEEQTSWSLGVLPGPGQTVMITNQGWKAVAIGANTTQNFPQSLNVSNVFLGGYTDSFSVLLLNHAGYEVPLTAGSINVGSNSAMTILASAVNVTNTGNSRLEVGGAVNQGEFPAVNTSILSLGNIGPGIYNLTNGTLTVVTGYVGGTFTGQLNQYGGYNSVATLSILGQGEYDLYDGALGGAVDLHNGGLIKQRGGTFVGSVWFDGTYELDGGLFTNANLAIPTTDNGYTLGYPAGEVLQTAGTNQTGAMYLGGRGTGDMLYYSPVPGAYVLSNGLLVATSTFLDVGGTVTQTGGTFTNSGQLILAADLLHTDYNPFKFFCGQYDLQGGFLAESSIVSSGYFTQSDGTNQVAGTTRISSIPTEGNEAALYNLSGGLFTTAGLALSNAVITQSGGSLLPGNLSLSANLAPTFYTTSYGYFGYDLSGGQLVVSSLQLGGYAAFHHRGGTLFEPGLLTLAGGLWDEQTSGQQFGQLMLSAPAGSNATFSLPSGNCIVQFANSSAQSWASGAMLSINNWHGSPSGGGASQIYFGSTPQGVTLQQLTQITFSNPAGSPAGQYPAQILATGEVVPAPGPTLQSLLSASQLVLTWGGNYQLLSATNVLGPYQLVPAAASPYTNDMGSEPQRFFRLRQ
jgi:hypothetical protein